MKHAILIGLFSLIASLVFAQPGAHRAAGVVTKVDAGSNRVTIRHQAVPSIKWPAMTMVFTVKDKATLARMVEHGKIDFEFVQQGRDYVVIAVK